MSSISSILEAHEFREYSANPFEAASKEIQDLFRTHEKSMRDESDAFKKALSSQWENPASEEGNQIKAGLQRYVAENDAALEWMRNPSEEPSVLLAVAARADRFAESYLAFAKISLGGERYLQSVSAGTLSPQEAEALRYAGKLFYSADVLRQGREK